MDRNHVFMRREHPAVNNVAEEAKKLKYSNFGWQRILRLSLLSFFDGLTKFYCPAVIYKKDIWIAVHHLPGSM